MAPTVLTKFDLIASPIVVNVCLQLLLLLQDTVRKQLTTEESHQKGSLGTHFGGVMADSELPLDRQNRLMNAFELKLPYSSDTSIDLGQTIEEAGLTPKAVVIFQRRRIAPRQVRV